MAAQLVRVLDLARMQAGVALMFDTTVQMAIAQRNPDGSRVVSQSGRVQFGPYASYPARVNYKQDVVLRPEGQEAITRAIVDVPASVPVVSAADVRIILPDGTTPPIIDVQTRPSFGTPLLKRILT